MKNLNNMRKKFTSSLIGQAALLLAMGVLSGADAYARHLQPEEALSVLASGPHKSASTAPLKLAFTQDADDQPAVYVFNREGSPGFYVLAADDAVGDIVLGYSDTDRFTPDNIAPGMRWLLEAYSRRVPACAAGIAATAASLPSEWEAVEPLLSTKWNQDAPYNGMCPIVFGARAVTGCVATAVAQVMKKYQWPGKGSGSMSYEYKMNNQRFEFSNDFSAHIYDWGNMLDDYSVVSATPTQKDAVAQLMADCGIVAETRYLPANYTSGSSGTLILAAAGMIEHFDYDKSMLALRREWFADDDWAAMLYHQISEGMPVLYSGQSVTGGHAFVLDGYNGAGLFHINWGWGSLGDGYYSVDDLKPSGTGHGAGSGSYNLDQEAMVNIKPNTGTTDITTVMAIVGNLSTEWPSYRAKGDPIYFRAIDGDQPGFFNFTTGEATVQFGIMIDDNVVKTAQNGNAFSMKPLNGMGTIGIMSSDFPKGEYDVSPVFRTIGGEWTPMRHALDTSGRLHFVNDGTTITVSEAQISNGIVGASADAVTVSSSTGIIRIDAAAGTNVSIYDVAGTLIYSGSGLLIPVAPHRLYIVVAGEKVFKVKA